MGNFIFALNQKTTLYALLIVAFIYEVFYGFGLGGLFVDFAVWFVGIGYILIPIIHSIINLIKPENTIKIDLIGRINLSLLIGVISGVLFGGLLNLGLLILGAKDS